MSATSFNLPDEFKNYLDSQAKKSKKTRTQYVIESVLAYSQDGKTKTQEQSLLLLDLLKKLESQEKEIQDIKTLIFQILKNQQT